MTWRHRLAETIEARVPGARVWLLWPYQVSYDTDARHYALTWKPPSGFNRGCVAVGGEASVVRLPDGDARVRVEVSLGCWDAWVQFVSEAHRSEPPEETRS